MCKHMSQRKSIEDTAPGEPYGKARTTSGTEMGPCGGQRNGEDVRRAARKPQEPQEWSQELAPPPRHGVMTALGPAAAAAALVLRLPPESVLGSTPQFATSDVDGLTLEGLAALNCHCHYPAAPQGQQAEQPSMQRLGSQGVAVQPVVQSVLQAGYRAEPRGMEQVLWLMTPVDGGGDTSRSPLAAAVPHEWPSAASQDMQQCLATAAAVLLWCTAVWSARRTESGPYLGVGAARRGAALLDRYHRRRGGAAMAAVAAAAAATAAVSPSTAATAAGIAAVVASASAAAAADADPPAAGPTARSEPSLSSADTASAAAATDSPFVQPASSVDVTTPRLPPPLQQQQQPGVPDPPSHAVLPSDIHSEVAHTPGEGDAEDEDADCPEVPGPVDIRELAAAAVAAAVAAAAAFDKERGAQAAATVAHPPAPSPSLPSSSAGSSAEAGVVGGSNKTGRVAPVATATAGEVGMSTPGGGSPRSPALYRSPLHHAALSLKLTDLGGAAFDEACSALQDAALQAVERVFGRRAEAWAEQAAAGDRHPVFPQAAEAAEAAEEPCARAASHQRGPELWEGSSGSVQASSISGVGAGGDVDGGGNQCSAGGSGSGGRCGSSRGADGGQGAGTARCGREGLGPHAAALRRDSNDIPGAGTFSRSSSGSTGSTGSSGSTARAATDSMPYQLRVLTLPGCIHLVVHVQVPGQQPTPAAAVTAAATAAAAASAPGEPEAGLAASGVTAPGDGEPPTPASDRRALVRHLASSLEDAVQAAIQQLAPEPGAALMETDSEGGGGGGQPSVQPPPPSAGAADTRLPPLAAQLTAWLRPEPSRPGAEVPPPQRPPPTAAAPQPQTPPSPAPTPFHTFCEASSPFVEAGPGPTPGSLSPPGGLQEGSVAGWGSESLRGVPIPADWANALRSYSTTMVYGSPEMASMLAEAGGEAERQPAAAAAAAQRPTASRGAALLRLFSDNSSAPSQLSATFSSTATATTFGATTATASTYTISNPPSALNSGAGGLEPSTSYGISDLYDPSTLSTHLRASLVTRSPPLPHDIAAADAADTADVDADAVPAGEVLAPAAAAAATHGGGARPHHLSGSEGLWRLCELEPLLIPVLEHQQQQHQLQLQLRQRPSAEPQEIREALEWLGLQQQAPPAPPSAAATAAALAAAGPPPAPQPGAVSTRAAAVEGGDGGVVSGSAFAEEREGVAAVGGAAVSGGGERGAGGGDSLHPGILALLDPPVVGLPAVGEGQIATRSDQHRWGLLRLFWDLAPGEPQPGPQGGGAALSKPAAPAAVVRVVVHQGDTVVVDEQVHLCGWGGGGGADGAGGSPGESAQAPAGRLRLDLSRLNEGPAFLLVLPAPPTAEATAAPAAAAAAGAPVPAPPATPYGSQCTCHEALLAMPLLAVPEPVAAELAGLLYVMTAQLAAESSYDTEAAAVDVMAADPRDPRVRALASRDYLGPLLADVAALMGYAKARAELGSEGGAGAEEPPGPREEGLPRPQRGLTATTAAAAAPGDGGSGGGTAVRSHGGLPAAALRQLRSYLLSYLWENSMHATVSFLEHLGLED